MTNARPNLSSTAPRKRTTAGWFLRIVPSPRLAMFRVLLGVYTCIYLIARLPHLLNITELYQVSFRPTGPVDLLLDSPLDRWAVLAIFGFTLATSVAFTLGWKFSFTGPVHAVALLFTLSYSNSFGQIFHTENLLVIHTAIVAVSPAAVAISMADPERQRRSWVSGWPLQLASIATVLTYLIAGISKLRNGGLGWINGEVLRNYVAYDNVRKIELGSVHSPVGEWLVGHAWIWGPLAIVSLVVELGAPLALLGQRAARTWAGAAWVFHVGVLAVMAIFFPYPLFGLAFAPFFRLEQAATRVDRAFDKFRLRFNRRRRNRLVKPL